MTLLQQHQLPTRGRTRRLDLHEIGSRRQGLTHEDVAEFLKRISLSDFFVSSKLISTDLSNPKIISETVLKKAGDPVVHFKLKGEVRYR